MSGLFAKFSSFRYACELAETEQGENAQLFADPQLAFGQKTATFKSQGL